MENVEMLKYFILLIILLIALSKIHVFYLEKDCNSLKKSIKKCTKDIKQLKIELTYLKQNSRLIWLAEEHLPNWKHVEIAQLKSLPREEK